MAQGRVGMGRTVLDRALLTYILSLCISHVHDTMWGTDYQYTGGNGPRWGGARHNSHVSSLCSFPMTMTPWGAVVTNIQVSNGPSGREGKGEMGRGRAGHYSHASSLCTFAMSMTPCGAVITNIQVRYGPGICIVITFLLV